MKRRTLVIDYRMSRSSGIGVYLRHMVRGLLDRHRDEFRIVLLGGEPVEDADEQRPMRAAIFTPRELVEVPLRIPRSAELVWSPNYNAPLLSPGRLVVTIHDTCHLALADLFGGLIKQKYARFMFANVRRRAHHVVCDSQFTLGEVEQRVGIERSRMTVIHPGVSEEWLSPVSAAPERPYILFVGNVKPHKNLGRLLEAFRRLAERIPHDLVILGKREGFITPDREVVIAAGSLGDRVRFVGEVSDEVMRKYYAGAELLVFPSLYEGFGYPPLEAMASNVPVAASRAASIPEICGSAAFYFDPYSVDDMEATIDRALRDQPARANMRAAGHEVVRRYSFSSAVEALAEVFHKVSRT